MACSIYLGSSSLSEQNLDDPSIVGVRREFHQAYVRGFECETRRILSRSLLEPSDI